MPDVKAPPTLEAPAARTPGAQLLETGSILQTRVSRRIFGISLEWWLLLALVMGVYGPTLLDLLKDWWLNPDYSHGLLLPFVVAFFLYKKKNSLAAMPAVPRKLGLAVIALSQAIFLAGYLGAEFFLQRFSLLVLLAGIIVFLWGWQRLWAVKFLFVVSLLSVPLPAIFFNAITLPLQLLASSWAETLLRACRVPVYREGNILELAHQTLNVTEACSGIRSLVSLLTLGVLLAYFLPRSFWLRVIFVLSTVPIALAANAFRVAGTGILAQSFGERAAQGFFHSFSGWLVFLVAAGLLMGESVVLERWARRKQRPVNVSGPAEEAASKA